MGQEAFTFWGAAAIPAVGPFLLNLVVRGKNVFASSGADFLLMLLAFDVTAAITFSDFGKFVPNADVRAALLPLAVGFMFLTLIIWYTVVSRFEPVYAQQSRHGKDLAKKIAAFAVTWLIASALTFGQIYLFFYVRSA